jgi:hypothetical protein
MSWFNQEDFLCTKVPKIWWGNLAFLGFRALFQVHLYVRRYKYKYITSCKRRDIRTTSTLSNSAGFAVLMFYPQNRARLAVGNTLSLTDAAMLPLSETGQDVQHVYQLQGGKSTSQDLIVNAFER